MQNVFENKKDLLNFRVAHLIPLGCGTVFPYLLAE